MHSSLRRFVLIAAHTILGAVVADGAIRLTQEEYIRRVHAGWAAQIIGMIMGYQFEHRQAAVKWISTLPDAMAGSARWKRAMLRIP